MENGSYLDQLKTDILGRIAGSGSLLPVFVFCYERKNGTPTGRDPEGLGLRYGSLRGYAACFPSDLIMSLRLSRY
jgi:hypothetical protein